MHRPLARVGVVADLDRHAEDLAVEAVDLAVLAHEILGQLDVATREGGLALDDLRARVARPSSRSASSISRSHRRLVARQRDHLGDVHALVAHALDVLDHVQQRRDQAQVAGDGRLQGEQREDALVHLQVAPVDAVVVGDHHLRELDVLVAQRLEHAVELLDDQVEAAEGVASRAACSCCLEVRPPCARCVSPRSASLRRSPRPTARRSGARRR